MKRFLISVTFACVVSSSALAGDIPSGGSPAPPPPNGITEQITPTSPGEVPSVGTLGQISDATLSALLNVLGLLAV